MDTKTMIVWVTAIIAAFALLLSPVACTMNRQHLVAEAIKTRDCRRPTAGGYGALVGAD